MARTLTGVVVSDKMEKTVNVAVTLLKNHPLYRKQYKSTRKFLAHDEDQSAGIGDKVLIQETRPRSRAKRWEVIEVIEKGPKV